jgi:elongation factor Ts
VLVALESTAPQAKLQELGKKIAMHVAAAAPISLNTAEVPADVLEREKAIFADQAKASGKPDNIIEKMVEGRVRKFYEESVLLEQTFVMDGETKISAVVENAAKEFGAPITLTGFARYALGEGIEKEEKNFAEEVAQQLAS